MLERLDLHNMHGDSFFAKRKKGDGYLVVFGTNKEAAWCLQYLKMQVIRTDYVCSNDSSMWGKTFEGYKVIAPADLPGLDKPFDIIICTKDFLPVQLMLEDLGIEGPLYVHPHYMPHTLKFAIENEDKVNEVYALLADEFSRRVYRTMLETRVSWEGQRYKSISTEPKYYPPDIFQFGDDEVFVDGGAHKGETVAEFVTAVSGKFDTAYGFEPDSRCFRHHETVCPLTRAQRSKVKFVNAGLHAVDGELKFKLTATEAPGTSQFDETGTDSIKVVSLDSYLSLGRVTFIKLDVEKSERAALKGAEQIIKKYRPKLAICVYHLHDDLWEIPLLVHEMVPEYKLYMRHHSWAENETVCYATV